MTRLRQRNAAAKVSIGTELIVQDAHLATTTLKDQVKDAVPIIQNVIRTAASRLVADPSREGRKAAAITSSVNAELSKFGLLISQVELTELYSQQAQPGLATEAVTQ